MIFHGTENEEFVQNIIDSHFVLDKDRIQLHNLNVSNLSWNEYNKLICTSDFTRKIPTEQFLIFQTDTMICPSEKNLIYDFLKYDYVGAPWSFEGDVGNGGLSLRRKSKMLEIIENNPYPDGLAEDLYFCRHNKVVSLHKSPFNEAILFSMETIFSSRCFGLHKAWCFQGDKIDEIESRFPGFKELIRLNS
jgi:hypothetical protein